MKNTQIDSVDFHAAMYSAPRAVFTEAINYLEEAFRTTENPERKAEISALYAKLSALAGEIYAAAQRFSEEDGY